MQSQLDKLDATIAALLVQITQQNAIIQQDFTTLQQQYTESLQPKCSFADVLNVLSSIVQLGLSYWLGVKDLTTALGVAQGIAGLVGGGTNLVQSMCTSDANPPSLASSWQSIQSTLQQYGSNSALIAVSDEQFETMIQQYYGGLPEAQTVEDDANEMISLVQSRNQTLLNYTSLYAQQQRLALQYQQKQSELEYVGALLASQQQPQLPEYLAFLQNSLNEIANSAIDNLYQEYQAYCYWSLDTQEFSVADTGVATLATVLSDIEGDVQNYLQNKLARPFSSFQGIYVVLNKQSCLTAFTRLAATQKLVVQLAPPSQTASAGTTDPFAGAYNVIAETVSISLPGIAPPVGSISTPTVLYVTLTQSGPDVKQAPDGQTVMEFSHLPREVTFEYNYTTQTNTITGTIGDQTQGFAGLSPFATWTIDFTSPFNSWLDLSQLTEVQLTFDGLLLGPDQPAEKSRA